MSAKSPANTVVTSPAGIASTYRVRATALQTDHYPSNCSRLAPQDISSRSLPQGMIARKTSAPHFRRLAAFLFIRSKTSNLTLDAYLAPKSHGGRHRQAGRRPELMAVIRDSFGKGQRVDFAAVREATLPSLPS